MRSASPAFLPSIVLVVSAGLGASVAHAETFSDSLDASVLERARKGQDCGKLRRLSSRLRSSWPQEPVPALALAEAHLCAGDVMAALRELEQHALLGGAAAARASLERELRRKTGATRVTVSAPAFLSPERVADGLSLSARDAEVERTGPLTWSVKSAAGPLELRLEHPDPDISTSESSVVVRGGRSGAVEVPLKASLSEIVVRPAPDAEVAAVVASAPAAEPVALERRDDNAWVGLVSTRFDGWRVSLAPGGPTTGPLDQDLEAVPGVTIELDVAPPQLPSATLAVGALDAALPVTIRLPNGLEVRPEAGSSLTASAGTLEWSVDWELDAMGSFDVAAGASTLPLPRAVEVTSGRWTAPQRWLLEPNAAEEDVLVTASVDGSGGSATSFVLSLPGVAPGELRRLDLDPASVPAIAAHQRIGRSEAALRRARGTTLASAGATVLFAGITGASLAAARASAAEAKGLDDPDDADTYEDLVEQTASRARLASVGLWSGVAGTGLTATLTWRSLGRARAHRESLEAFEQARKIPHVAAVSEAGGDAGGG